MMENGIPTNYDEWHHCITVECGIPLSHSFLDERIKSLGDVDDFRTKQFLQLYGPQHHQSVLTWFKQAKSTLPA